MDPWRGCLRRGFNGARDPLFRGGLEHLAARSPIEGIALAAVRDPQGRLGRATDLGAAIQPELHPRNGEEECRYSESAGHGHASHKINSHLRASPSRSNGSPAAPAFVLTPR